jgi:chorismate mutase/prephenate dehydratase|tara:strand:+ start:296 stop:1372 length:1077 start_codon:yes stop_codon:yes gene_type:complete
MPKEDELSKVRKAIDSIDDQILSLLNERAELAISAGKTKTDSDIYKPARESLIFNRLTDMNKGPLNRDQIINIFNEIISSCRSTESTFTVSFLGPEGTFSESALEGQFGKSVTKLPEENIKNIFESVSSGGSDFGIVPIENSTEGSVNLTLDCLAEFDLKICGEIELQIHHNLLGHNRPLPKEGFEIHAHEQTLGQCRKWLESYCPGVKLVSVSSNAEAAANVTNDNQIIAIAGSLAAEKYGLDILNSNIEDYSGNTTRFLTIGKVVASQTGRDKTSLMATTKNEQGALFSLLEPFNRLDINLSHLTYRPSKINKWQYSFFIDFDGHKDDDLIQELFSNFSNKDIDLKMLGSYPKSLG